MTRQIGTVLGVSVLVAVIGTHASYGATHAAFQHAWWIIVGATLRRGAELVRHDAARRGRQLEQSPRRTLLAFADRR